MQLRFCDQTAIYSPTQCIFITALIAPQAFKQEIAWATHLSLSACLCPPVYWNCANYASCLNSSLHNLQAMQLWVRVPLVVPDSVDASGAASEWHDSWDCWQRLRAMCDYHPQLGVALEVTEDLLTEHDSLSLERLIRRWRGEPVRAIIVHTNSFLTNQRGYPVLAKSHQQFLSAFFHSQHTLSFVLAGPGHLLTQPRTLNAKSAPVTTPTNSYSIAVYQRYLQYLHKMHPPLSDLDQFEKPYWDYLQTPLQPLMDNLESATYDVFEKDPVKYRLYREAVHAALTHEPHLVAKRARSTSEPVIILVLGAGRGPLVDAALKASRDCQWPEGGVRVFIVEKNPNAIITLRNRVKHDPDLAWRDITVYEGDARYWTWQQTQHADLRADIVISEMLGSFGDNESSPECLQHIHRLMHAASISIPYDYTSYLAPLCSSKLWNEVRAYNDLAHFETAYVVKIYNADLLDQPQPCFTFTHPDRAVLADNSRYHAMQFSTDQNSVIHGFAGYFESVLYQSPDKQVKVLMSIHPDTHSDQMFSWFPIYFPLRTPIYVTARETIHVQFWRLLSDKKMWYEWQVQSAHHSSPIHNPNGRSYFIGL